eukprot:6213229-Pleurochrysis_carterae.AAC.3
MSIKNTIDESKFCRVRRGTGIPDEYESTHTRVGKGANNEVILLLRKPDNAKYILRRPLKDADTRNWEDARMEARYTHLASEKGICPHVVDMWYVRRSSKSTAQRRGLNMVMEHFTTSLSRLIRYEPEEVLKNAAFMQQDILDKLSRIADSGLFCMDIKPDNTVVRKNDDFTDKYECKLIDFGADFCEHIDLSDVDADGCLHALKKAVKDTGQFGTSECDEEAIKAECKRAMLAAMLILYVSHFQSTVSHCRRSLFFPQAWALNIMLPCAQCMLANSSAEQLSFVKTLVAHKKVTSLMQHYIGYDDCRANDVFPALCRRVKFPFLSDH